MSDLMRPIPFDNFIDWIFAEYKKYGTIFGIREEKFYRNESGACAEMFNEKLATPIGPAAGPNSQLCQNIVAAYLTGSRFVELKTVQKMDGEDLRKCVPRPCINAQDEGYNVEWSTELTVPEALDEYVKAWVALHVVGCELGLSTAAGGAEFNRDFIFNMSVGYDLDGIKSEKIDGFIEGLKDASQTAVFRDAIAYLGANVGRFKNVDAAFVSSISPNVCSSITLSTLHGCPPTEIERIARYLLDEKKLHTYIKCNPTLLGYEYARSTLDAMGYGYLEFDDHHFRHDLQYSDAVVMLRGLQDFAKERGLAFGVKITNTFPVKIGNNELPGEQMYMSGRALYPLSLTVAQRLSKDFGGKLPISYSGGADAFNIADLYSAGINPITVCTTILKPGGYSRLTQLACELEGQQLPNQVDVSALELLVGGMRSNRNHLKSARPVASRKTDSKLGVWDCFKAPCKNGGCPIEQQIPEYLKLVADGKNNEAFEVIAVDNASPAITGVICNHACQSKCTRLDYDTPLAIRAIKREAVLAEQDKFIAKLSAPAVRAEKRVAVVGAGPGGVAAALFLRRNGVDVTVFEKRERPYGIVSYVIPEFRISREMIEKDYELAVKTGVKFEFNKEITDIAALRGDFGFVVLATGAWGKGALNLAQGEDKLVDALAFLEESKAKDCNTQLGKRVAVIGGGDVAMDCARAAKRAPGVEDVTIVYRRTKEFMPAEPEELAEAEADGVNFALLLSPVSYDGQTLTCEQMEFTARDTSGRKGVRGIGVQTALAFDTVICAVGAQVDTGVFTFNGIELNARGGVKVGSGNETSVADVYVAGDAKSGPSTIVAAIADGKAIAADILRKLGLPGDFIKKDLPQDAELLYARKGTLLQPHEGASEGCRCLTCDQLCEICVDVCPNRANIAIVVPGAGTNPRQILHVDGMCNECGNCGIFCPHSGDPYKDKLTLFWTMHDFEDSTNIGFLPLGGGKYKVRTEGKAVLEHNAGDGKLSGEMAAAIAAVQAGYPWLIRQ
ncbi:MAG: putative selenate reductase subunit YgfK [Defluviitaleaceae bacterium]|nr:putative selenate reductase subunit YgfK [Defluviitaleaceae bacterium]